ncbi:hypothetical protein QF013_000090 [Pseudomonas laurylsulfatiphila]
MNHQTPITIIHHNAYDKMLVTLLAMHEDGKDLTPDFVQANGDVLSQIFKKGLGSYSVTRMVAGQFRFRRAHTGLLTPPGIAAAKALKQST